jgi:hypothetical protein
MGLVFTDEELALLADRWLDWEDRPLVMRRNDQILFDLLRRGTAVALVAKCGSLLELRDKDDEAEEVRRFEALVVLARAVRALHGTGRKSHLDALSPSATTNGCVKVS